MSPASLWRKWRKRRDLQVWRTGLRARGGFVCKTTCFTGRPPGYTIVSTGSGLCIEPQVTIWVSEDRAVQPRLILGQKVYICRNTYLGVHEPIAIGDNTMIGAYSYIISANHRYASRAIPIRDQGFEGAPIQIGEDVWIGTHVVILPGITIGKGAIIAAGSIVNRNVPAYEIWGGAPARFLKMRPE